MLITLKQELFCIGNARVSPSVRLRRPIECLEIRVGEHISTLTSLLCAPKTLVCSYSFFQLFSQVTVCQFFNKSYIKRCEDIPCTSEYIYEPWLVNL